LHKRAAILFYCHIRINSSQNVQLDYRYKSLEINVLFAAPMKKTVIICWSFRQIEIYFPQDSFKYSTANMKNFVFWCFFIKTIRTIYALMKKLNLIIWKWDSEFRLDEIYHSSILSVLNLFLINELCLNGRRISTVTDQRKLLNFTYPLVSCILIKCAKNIHKSTPTKAEVLCQD